MVSKSQATRWASYGKRFTSVDPCPAIAVKAQDYCEGRLSVWDDSMTPLGYTGVLWRVQAPTGWSEDRYNKDYVVQPTTGMVGLSGETGPSGSYDVFWKVDMKGVTGVGTRAIRRGLS